MYYDLKRKNKNLYTNERYKKKKEIIIKKEEFIKMMYYDLKRKNKKGKLL
jgi:hypothetical protein